MGLHQCPIEPDDWSNGPDVPEGVECSNCDGTGEVIDAQDNERTCPACQGSGFADPADFEPVIPDYD